MAPIDQASAYARDVHAWLVRLDPASFHVDRVPEVREQLGLLGQQADALLQALDGADTWARLRADLVMLRDALPPAGAPPGDRDTWLDLRVELAPLYEAFALELKQAGGKVRHLHPTNYLRSVVHLASGLLVVAAFEFVFTPTSGALTALAFVIWAWSLEYARRRSERVNALCMRFFGPIARDHERYRVNSATWYGTALLVLALTAYGPAGVLGLLALAVGDPLAGLVGRKAGRIRLYGGKSLEGSIAFALGATLVGYLYLLAFHIQLAGSFALLGLAVVAGVTGALVELLTTRLEDNFTIPVFTAWVALAWMTLAL